MNIKILKETTEPIFYVTNDVERAVGLENILPNYHIVCLDDHPVINYLQKSGISVFCLERELGIKNALFRSSAAVLAHPKTLDFIKKKSGDSKPNIIFFKPQKKIEIIAGKFGFNLIGNTVDMNRLFEDKLSFFSLCREEGIKVPPGEIIDLSSADFTDLSKRYTLPFVVQFGRGWAGNSTLFVSDEIMLSKLKADFGAIKVKISKYIKGLTLLNNSVVFGRNILASKPALQIKAEKYLTSMEGGTGGRQWPVELEEKQEEEVEKITQEVGRLMKKHNYRGFFGLDFLVEEKTGNIYLSENNARLTASASFYTKLELESNTFPLLGYHLLSFLPKTQEDEHDYTPVSVSGSEIVARNTGSKAVKALGSVKTGIYNQNLEFKKESYFLDSGKQDFWLQTVAEGRLVNPEIEIARINTYGKVCDKKGKLLERYSKILKKIIGKLKLKTCQG